MGDDAEDINCRTWKDMEVLSKWVQRVLWYTPVNCRDANDT